MQHINSHDVHLSIHLGDIVDGNETVERTRDDLQSVINCLDDLQRPVIHVLGNHCLDAGREYLVDKLRLPEPTYYFKDVSEKWRIIVLDSVDLSVHREESHPLRAAARKYLDEHVDDANAKDWNSGLGPDQIVWLQDVLRRTAEEGRFAIVCGHHPIVADAALPTHLIWDSAKVAQLLHSNAGTVKAYFCGHYHEGGYAEVGGVHHVTFESVVDSGAEGACGIVELRDSEIVVVGSGTTTSRRMMF